MSRIPTLTMDFAWSDYSADSIEKLPVKMPPMPSTTSTDKKSSKNTPTSASAQLRARSQKSLSRSPEI